MSTIGHNFPEAQQPINPRFLKTCSTCKEGNKTIDSSDKFAREMQPGKWQCGSCIEKEIDDIYLRIEPPNSDRRQQIIYKRMREMQEKLKQDEINHIRMQNRIKITVKSPKRFLQKKQAQPQKQVKTQSQQPQQPKRKLKIIVRRPKKIQNVKGWAAYR